MGLVKDDGAGHITITYGGMEAPFAGLDSSMPDAYLPPGAVYDVQNFTITDGSCTVTRWKGLTVNWGAFDIAYERLIGFGEAADIFYAATYNSNTGFLQWYSWVGTNGIADAPNVQTIPFPPTLASNWTTLAAYAINGTLYFTGAGLGCIYQWPLPTRNGAVVAPTVLTLQCGGTYLGELNGRLLAFNTLYLQPDLVTYLPMPYQVAWSAAQQQYGIWNVLTTSFGVQVPTGAGYNNIPDVQDIIRGFFSQGSTTYVIRTEGVTTITPLSNGIEPFDFNHMWASAKGMGTRFSATVSQYGSLGAFVSSIDIVTLGYSGLATITGPAKSNIYGFLNAAASTAQVAGAVAPMNVADTNSLSYILTQYIGTAAQFRTFIIDLERKNTMQLLLNDSAADAIQAYNTVSMASILGLAASTSPLSTLVMALAVSNGYPHLYYIPGYATASDPITDTAYLVFPPEEVGFLQEITIDGIGFYLYGDIGVSIQPMISGVQFETVTVNKSGWNYYRSMPNAPNTNVMTVTGQAPQLTLTQVTQGQLSLGKAVLYGSYAPARPF